MNRIIKRKLLVTGISGFLGSYLSEVQTQKWSIHGLYNYSPVQQALIQTTRADLLNHHTIQAIIEDIRPDAILHLAAQSNPNYCEQHPETSQKINVEVPVFLTQLSAEYEIPFLFVSSDLVFDGTSGPYIEAATPNPISVYGQQKAAAEKAILDIYPKACIARCPVMFGLPRWGKSFMGQWIHQLRMEQPIYAFTDEYRTKVSGQTAVEGILLLLEKQAHGIFHMGGKERISRYNFALKMAEIFGLRQDLIRPSIRADVKMPAARPADVSLVSQKAYGLGYNPPRLAESLIHIKNKIVKTK